MSPRVRPRRHFTFVGASCAFEYAFDVGYAGFNKEGAKALDAIAVETVSPGRRRYADHLWAAEFQ